MAWPVIGRVTYDFHDTDYLYVFPHDGLDIAVGQGTIVRASYDGEVAGVYNGGMTSASYLSIKHASGISTVYGHLSRMDVQDGQKVTKGQVIGLSGGTPGTNGAGPFTTGPHLHFEVRVNGVPVDPMGYLR